MRKDSLMELFQDEQTKLTVNHMKAFKGGRLPTQTTTGDTCSGDKPDDCDSSYDNTSSIA